MFDITKLLLVGLGGSLGAVCRYLISEGSSHRLGDGFPWGTMFVNLIGCFAMGLLVGWGLNSSHRGYVLFAIGFLGSLTTFSAFSGDSLRLLNDGKFGIALLNVLANVVLCLFVAWLGMMISKWAQLGSAVE